MYLALIPFGIIACSTVRAEDSLPKHLPQLLKGPETSGDQVIHLKVTEVNLEKTMAEAYLSWSAVVGADYYQVQISEVKSFAHSTQHEPQSSELKVLVLKPGTVFWRVRAYQNHRPMTEFSDVSSIQFSYEIVAPEEPKPAPPPPPPPPVILQSFRIQVGFQYSLFDHEQSLNTLNENLKPGSGFGSLSRGLSARLQFLRGWWGFEIGHSTASGSVPFKSNLDGGGRGNIKLVNTYFMGLTRWTWKYNLTFLGGMGIASHRVGYFWFEDGGFSALISKKFEWVTRGMAYWHQPGKKWFYYFGLDSALGLAGFPGYWSLSPRLGVLARSQNFGLGLEYIYRPTSFKTTIAGNPLNQFKAQNEHHIFLFSISYNLPWFQTGEY